MVMKRICCLALLLLGLPPLFGQEHSGPEKSDPYAKRDPFAELPDTKMITVEYYIPSMFSGPPMTDNPDRKPAQEVLESYGIHFPKGATADLNLTTSKLRVTQTINNLEKIDQIIESIRGGPEKLIYAEVEVFEMSPTEAAPILEMTRGNSFRHNSAHEAIVERVEKGSAKRTAAVRVISRSGQRSKAENISEEVTHINELKWDADAGQLVPNFVPRNVGTFLEVDPVIGGDDVTLDFNLVFHHDYRTPDVENLELNLGSEHPQLLPMHRFHQHRITTQITTLDGYAVLLGRFTDKGTREGEEATAERLVFLSARIQHPEEIGTERLRRTIDENPEVEESE